MTAVSFQLLIIASLLGAILVTLAHIAGNVRTIRDALAAAPPSTKEHDHGNRTA